MSFSFVCTSNSPLVLSRLSLSCFSVSSAHLWKKELLLADPYRLAVEVKATGPYRLAVEVKVTDLYRLAVVKVTGPHKVAV